MKKLTRQPQPEMFMVPLVSNIHPKHELSISGHGLKLKRTYTRELYDGYTLEPQSKQVKHLTGGNINQAIFFTPVYPKLMKA